MSKKIIIVAVLAVLLIGGVFYFVQSEKGKKRIAKRNARIETVVNNTSSLDADNDGLRDWEEILWKTDAGNPDTDGDGFQDGAEVKNGYDPLDSNSNPDTGEKKAAKPYFSVSQSSNASDAGNLTMELGRVFNKQAINSLQGGNVNLNSVLAMDPSASESVAQFVASFEINISKEEFKISKDNSFEAAQAYVELVGRILPQVPYSGETEDDIFKEAVREKNFGKIDEFIKIYKTAIIAMKQVTIPSAFFEIHKRETELFAATQKVYETVKNIEDDPLKTALAFQKNVEIRKEMKDMMFAFIETFQKVIPPTANGQNF